MGHFLPYSPKVALARNRSALHQNRHRCPILSRKYQKIRRKTHASAQKRQPFFLQQRLINYLEKNMTENTITLAEVPNFPIGKLSALSPDQLLFLQEEAEKNLKRAKILKDWLDSSIALKYREISANIRNLDSKDRKNLFPFFQCLH